LADRAAPEGALRYRTLSHRSAHRLADFTAGKVTFRWKDYAHGGKRRLLTLTAEEFLRRFLLPTLPRGFIRIRFFGFLARRRRAALWPLCQELLEANPGSGSPTPPTPEAPTPAIWICPRCGGPMVAIERLTPQQIRWEPVGQRAFVDTS